MLQGIVHLIIMNDHQHKPMFIWFTSKISETIVDGADRDLNFSETLEPKFDQTFHKILIDIGLV